MLFSTRDETNKYLVEMIEQSYGRAAQYSKEAPNFLLIYEEFTAFLIEVRTTQTYNEIFGGDTGFVEEAIRIMNSNTSSGEYKKLVIFNELVNRGYFFEHEEEFHNEPHRCTW